MDEVRLSKLIDVALYDVAMGLLRFQMAVGSSQQVHGDIVGSDIDQLSLCDLISSF